MNKIDELLTKIPEDMDAVLITSKSSRHYLLDFTSSAGTLVVTRKESAFIVDSRYFEMAKNVIKCCKVISLNNLNEQLLTIFKRNYVSKIGIESKSMTVSRIRQLKKQFTLLEFVENDSVSNAISDMRSVKSNDEIEKIKSAQKLADMTFEHILNKIKVGKTEREISLEMEFFMRKNGADDRAFDFIVVSGKNSSIPHGVPSLKKIEYGDLITMDFGAVINGYHSDMTRTVCVGEASVQQKKVYGIVRNAKNAAIESIKSGKFCSDIDSTARNVIKKEGYGENFGHSLGHGIGLEIHEAPSFSQTSNTVLKSGMVVTVEPGIYIEGIFGIRIEDTIIVTDNGCINITQTTDELIII